MKFKDLMHFAPSAIPKVGEVGEVGDKGDKGEAQKKPDRIELMREAMRTGNTIFSRVTKLLEETPGLSARDISDKLDVNVTSLHLNVHINRGRLKSVRANKGGYPRYYLPDQRPINWLGSNDAPNTPKVLAKVLDRAALAANMRANASGFGTTKKRIFDAIDGSPGISVAGLARKLKLNKGAFSRLAHWANRGEVRRKMQDGSYRYYAANYKFSDDPKPEVVTTPKPTSPEPALVNPSVNPSVDPRDWVTEQRLKRAQARAAIEPVEEAAVELRREETHATNLTSLASLEARAMRFIWEHPECDVETLKKFVEWEENNV